MWIQFTNCLWIIVFIIYVTQHLATHLKLSCSSWKTCFLAILPPLLGNFLIWFNASLERYLTQQNMELINNECDIIRSNSLALQCFLKRLLTLDIQISFWLVSTCKCSLIICTTAEIRSNKAITIKPYAHLFHKKQAYQNCNFTTDFKYLVIFPATDFPNVIYVSNI